MLLGPHPDMRRTARKWTPGILSSDAEGKQGFREDSFARSYWTAACRSPTRRATGQQRYAHPQIWCDKGEPIAIVSTSNRGRPHARSLRRASRAGMGGIQRRLQALDPVNWRLENGGGAGSCGPARKAVLWQVWREAMTSGVSNGTRDGSPTRKLRAPAAARRR